MLEANPLLLASVAFVVAMKQRYAVRIVDALGDVSLSILSPLLV